MVKTKIKLEIIINNFLKKIVIAVNFKHTCSMAEPGS